jgi:hypothetical protein
MFRENTSECNMLGEGALSTDKLLPTTNPSPWKVYSRALFCDRSA